MKWEVKYTGKGLNLFIFILLSVMFVLLLILYYQYRDSTLSIRRFGLALLFLSPILIVWILFFAKYIFKKLIPTKIECFNDDVKFYFGAKSITFKIDSLSYDFYEYRFYNVLVVSKMMETRRGDLIHKEFMSIVGLKYGNSWSMSMVKEVAQYFNLCQVERSNKKDIGFFRRIFE